MQGSHQSIFQTQNYCYKCFSLRVKTSMGYINHDVHRSSPREDAKAIQKKDGCVVFTKPLICIAPPQPQQY